MASHLYIAWDGADNHGILYETLSPRAPASIDSAVCRVPWSAVALGGLELATKIEKQPGWAWYVVRSGITSERKFQLDLAKCRHCPANGALGASRWPSP
jgi:hypothetical protein